MLCPRWFGIAIVCLVVAASGSAQAQVLTITADPIDAGPILVNGMGSANASLSSDTNNTRVDIVMGTCTITTGMGTFMLSTTEGSLIDVNLNGGETITATYSPTTRGLRECTVNVFATGTTTPLLKSFRVRGTGVAPVMTTTPIASHSFGPVRYNDAAPIHTATLALRIDNDTTDTGVDLTINDITFVGGQTGDYSVSGTFPATIAPGAFQTFTVTFDPAIAGASSTTLQIASDDPTQQTKNIMLSGTGATGVIAVTDATFPLPVRVGTTATQNITVSNSGAVTKGPLGVTLATFMGNTAGWFKFNTTGCVGTTTPCALSMSLISNTGTLPILCNPPVSAAIGTQTAMVVFTSDTDNATDTIAQLSCTSGRAEISVVTTPLTFTDQLVNTTSPAQNVMITNSGNIDLSYSLAFTDATHFIVNGGTGCTTNCQLAPGNTNVTVQFRPTSVGMKTSALRVTPNNDDDTPGPFDVPLSGTGVAPVSTPSATMFAFGSIDVGDTATAQTLTITNTGTYPLTINAAYMSAGGGDYVVTGTTGTSGLNIVLATNDTATWMLACKPTIMNSRPGTFTISSNHNGASNTLQNFPLSCNGLQGLLSFAATPPNPYDYGPVREGEVRDVTFTLRNTGNTPVTNISVAFSGTGTGYSILSPTFPIASIAGGGTASIVVRFAPLDGTYGGTYVGTFSGGWGNAKTTMTTLTLYGDGLTTGYDTSPSNPNALDFGNVRYDQTKLMYVSVINTAGTPFQVRTISITPGTAFTGEFIVNRCLKNNIQMVCPTMAAPYNSSGLNDTIVLEIRVDPQNRVAMLDAVLTLTSDLAVNGTRTVPLRANSVSAMMGLDPATMVLDFGPTDLDATPVTVTRTVRLTNTGVAPLDFLSVTKTGGPLGNVRFTFGASPAPFTLQPNGTYDVTVSYTPVLEKPSSQPDTGSIVIGGVAGDIATPATVTIQLRGYGVDRHIALGPVPVYPDTYTNPGDRAPVMPVSVINNGDANLNVSAVMLTNDPIWTVVNPDPVDIAGRATHDFMVRFAPIIEGKAPTGNLTIINNDNGMPMASMNLDGNGKGRNVRIDPAEIDFGYVGIGMTVKISEKAPTELLKVQNGDPTEDWLIDRVDVTGTDADAFEAVMVNGRPISNVMLGPSSNQDFEVLFTPTHVGDFEAQLSVVLDGAPQQPITVRGRGLYVDTRGGGGCSTGSGGGAAMILVVLALVLGGRRRGAAAIVATLAGVSAARAEQTRNANPTVFDPTPAATTEQTFQVQGAEVAEQGSYGVFALVSYANKPLILDTSQNDHYTIENRTTLELGFAYALSGFELGARMPFYLQTGEPNPTMEERKERFGVEPGGTAIGDLTAHGKFQIGARDNLSYGVGVALTAPTASDDKYAGTKYPTGRALFLLSLVQGPFTAHLNAGAAVRARTEVGSANQGSGGIFGAGLSWRVLDKLWLAGEIFGELVPGGESGQPATGEMYGPSELGKPIEGLVGLRYQMARTTSLGIAAGRGVTDDMGSPAIRGVVTLSITPNAQEFKPLPRAPRPTPKDADGDAITDARDSCVNEPEDKDLWDDVDGCPDNDNDSDALLDAQDKCPLDAEDKDSFQDEDGCPEHDNDKDGTLDSSDKCPAAAEDKDGFEDTDGCPESDNDKDGLFDKVDKCPREAETINGNADDDGCPDKGFSSVVLSPDRLELMESVQFSGSKIAKASHSLLGQVGATLRAHPEILRVRLTAHVNPTGNTSADQKLSEARAKAVRDWLVEWGIDPLRVQASGFGGSKPLVPPSSKGAQQLNDRLDLIILEKK